MKVKMGPMTVNYEGSASLVEVDDARHRAVISLRAREAKGQGTALATITNDVEQVGSRVTVRAETDLQVTGPQARFGRGVMEDVGNRVLAEFAARLEQEVAPAADASSASAADSRPAAAAAGRRGVRHGRGAGADARRADGSRCRADRRGRPGAARVLAPPALTPQLTARER